MSGRYNFLNMARYGDLVEGTYRNNFARPVNFLGINLELVRDNLSRDLILAFDPSFLPYTARQMPNRVAVPADRFDPVFASVSLVILR
ncbi:MAG: hypothetical protein ACJATN_002468 [Neolewinella sp.]|jgi:hypothetical protein